MNRIKLYVAAVNAAAAAIESKTQESILAAKKEAFAATGLTAIKDFELFSQQFDIAANQIKLLASEKLPSEVASAALSHFDQK